ncbi:MAG: cellulase family glycosylhydrolase, partial [bacterium]|nr:cellulase family glycosylhydrolase [Candidatus Colisoma equi]
MQFLLLVLVIGTEAVAWADFELLPRRFGSVYGPNEMVDIPYRANTSRLDRIEVRDWRGHVVWMSKNPVQTGSVSLGAENLGNRFGAFQVVFVGKKSMDEEQVLKKTWFARLTSATVKPIRWIGTGGHGWGKDMRRYDLMAAAGIGTFRNDASWADCERKPGVYTEPSGCFRENVAALKTRGISLNLCMPHKNTGAYPESPFNSDAYAAFAEWVVKSYPEVGVFEIFNEPSAQYWQALKAPWAHLFLDLTAKTKKRIRAVRPDANIVVCAECELRCLYWELEGGIAEKGDCV